MQSEDDSLLKNFWDEVCVQAQFEESYMWDAYLDTISRFINNEIQKLKQFVLEAIFLQTDAGMDWQLEIEDELSENENQESIPVCDEDITEYILQNYVLSDAMDYTNKRIRKYFELI